MNHETARFDRRLLRLGLVAFFLFLGFSLALVLVENRLAQDAGQLLVFLVEVFNLEAFLVGLATGARRNHDDHDDAQHDGKDLGEEQAVVEKELAHTARPTLFFCSTCSAR